MLPKHQVLDFGPYKVWEMESQQQFIQIIPHLGGMINCFKNGKQSYISGYKDGIQASDEHTKFYKCAKLCPSPNRTRHGKFLFEGKEYQMPLNFDYGPHQIHGFIANKPFRVVGQGSNSQDGGFLTMQYNYEGNHEGFPLPFRIEITHTMHAENGFTTETFIQNTGQQNMPLGDGWHPYFHINGLTVDQLELQLPNTKKLLNDEEMIPTGELTDNTQFTQLSSVGKTQFDDCFLIQEEGISTTKLYHADSKKGIEIWQEADAYPYLQLFTPDDRKSIAIEPMSCPADALNSGTGLIVLQAEETWTGKWGIRMA